MEEQKIPIKPTRPFLLSILCVALFVHSATLTIIFLLATFFNGWIFSMLQDYFPEKNINNSSVLMLSLLGFVLNGLAFTGIYNMWKLKRSGLYLYSAASLVFILFPFFLGFGNLASIIIIVVLIGLLFLFYRRLT